MMSSMYDIGPAPTVIEDTPRTGRRTSRSERIEVITRGEGRRVWTLEQKRDVVVASLQPGFRPSDIARLHGINTGQLYTWRRQMLEGQLGGMQQPAPSFTRVELADDRPPLDPPPRVGFTSPNEDIVTQQPISPPLPPPRTNSSRVGLIEIMLPGGISVRVDSQVDGQALRQVLAALEGR
jgi:transposase